MQLTRIRIRNFKGIQDMELRQMENALILVGKNNTGKTSILDAVRVVLGARAAEPADFVAGKARIEMEAELLITEEDRRGLHAMGAVSRYKRYEIWEREFYKRLPSLEGDRLSFTFAAGREGKVWYGDGVKKDNPHIREVLPRLYDIDTGRKLGDFQRDILFSQENQVMSQVRSDRCLFDTSRECSHCFECIGLIGKKAPLELTALETRRLLEYKLYQSNMGELVGRINENFHKNGGYEELFLEVKGEMDRVFDISVRAAEGQREDGRPAEQMSKGMKSIYMLSLLETYIEGENRLPSIILVEYPELFLHPQLQKTASEILYRLSKKNQVLFNTHSPQLLLNFTERQIRQVVLNPEHRPVVRENADIGEILDDLGYGAVDALNVDFVFIVEGRQDKSRLPLLLDAYYPEIRDENGNLSRISIITTNSCTNIRTYANLKYMNQVYLKDQFLMIRDGDGKNREELAAELCSYYERQNRQDVDRLPRVTRRNVLVLKYYSFENYFLNPSVMAKLGIVKSEEQFYDILWKKWREYLSRLSSGKRFTKALGHPLRSKEELREQMELFKIHLRGHNLYDIFYGRYKKRETEILKQYIQLAPREDFADILDAIDRFVYFESRKKME